MLQVKIKAMFYGLLFISSVQLGACKSKAKDKDSTVQSTTIDSSATLNTAPVAPPIQISPDDSLQTGLRDATKDYPDVKTTVSNGEVTLTGNIARNKLPTLMQSINSLHPKKINNNLTVK